MEERGAPRSAQVERVAEQAAGRPGRKLVTFSRLSESEQEPPRGARAGHSFALLARSASSQRW